MQSVTSSIGLLILVATTFAQAATTSKPIDTGLLIDMGPAGQYTLGYPQFINLESNLVHPLTTKVISGDTVDLNYEGGASVHIVTKPDGGVEMKLASLSADSSSMRCEIQLSIDLIHGGKWSVDQKSAHEFPPTTPKPPQFFSDHASAVTITPKTGDAFSLKLPLYTYLELTDNRAWGWDIFMLRATIPLRQSMPPQSFNFVGNSAKAKN